MLNKRSVSYKLSNGVNKKGQEVGTLVIFLVVAIIAGVILILAINGQFGNLKTIFGGGATDLATVETACTTACGSVNKASYCKKYEITKLIDTQLDKLCTFKKLANNVGKCAISSVDDLVKNFGCVEVKGDVPKTLDNCLKSVKVSCEDLAGANLIKECNAPPTC